MTTIDELKPTVFAELEKIAPDLKLFEIIGGGSEIDELYVHMYGFRKCAENTDSAKVAVYMKMLYSSAWDTAFYLFQNTENILPDLGKQNRRITLTEYKYTDVTSVPSFDSEELNTETNFSHSEVGDDGINKETVTDENKDIKDFKESFEFLMTNWVTDIIFSDLNGFMTQHIHI